MLEVELTSELVIAGMSGMQDKKKSIDEFYEEREDSYPSMKIDKQRFENVMEELSESFPGGLGGSVFRRPPLFYTLYCVVFHRRFGLPGIQRQSPKKKLTLSERDGLREAVEKLSDIFANLKSDKTYSPPKKYAHFISATTRQTDNIIPRKARFDSLYDEAF